MTSIIRQRQRTVGERNWGIFVVGLGVVAVVIMGLASIDARMLASPVSGVLGLGYIAIGGFRLRATRRKLAAFEAEHGAGAGKQPSIR
jgi:hypothetical protein